MSDLKSKADAIRFVPVVRGLHPASAAGHVLFGVIYPGFVVLFELVSRMCAKDLFDPMPSPIHVLAVAFVPAANLWALTKATHGKPGSAKYAAFANGAAIAIAAFYALLFLPITPVAIIAIMFGIGLLPLAPMSALISALFLRRALRRRQGVAASWRAMGAGLAAGLGLLLVLDVPSAATRLGLQWAASDDTEARERGIKLIRGIGDRDMLLRLCYDATARPNGLLSAAVLLNEALAWGRANEGMTTTALAREVYYRVTGDAFNAVPVPFINGRWERFADFQFDNDHGGAQVGGRVHGVSLASSRIDGTIAADDAVAYLEWTFEFKNTSFVDREARVQIALPPGGVVSRATLWVNGEEREAAYGGRAQVRAAYQRVAVQQRRDPLLVTTKGADRVLAQAFPVPRNGGTIRFKVGITAPLDLAETGKARLVLPAVFDRNFSIGSGLRHDVWIDSARPVTVAAPGLAATDVSPHLHRISGQIDDAGLARRRVSIIAQREPTAARSISRLGDGPAVLQELVEASATPGALMIVVDGSKHAESAAEGLIEAFNAIPETARVGLMIAAQPINRLPVSAWTAKQKQEAIRLLRAHSFSGGEDNAPAIAEALLSLERESTSRLLWVHAPQPLSFAASGGRLEQAAARLSRLPQVTLYATEPGPNELLPDTSWAWSARALPASGQPGRDIADYFSSVFSTKASTVLLRRSSDATEEAAVGSSHIARLWAANRVLNLMAQSKQAEAVALAAQYRLVTPVTGAVVLESQQQFEEAQLTPVAAGTVPTVPEPHEWAMILMTMCGFGWMLWRGRQRLGATT